MERKISNKGGITIPSNMRRALGIEGREKVKFETLENGDILVRRIQGTCILCGGYEAIKPFKGKFVCESCRKELGA